MVIEWDEEKNKINLQKHGISFEEVKEAFNDPFLIELYDKEHSTLKEDRYICLGSIGNFVIVYVVFTDRKGKIRIISARKAEPLEEKAYYENVKRTLGRN